MSKSLFYFLLFLSPMVVSAQEDRESELYKTLYKMDSLLFEEGFNKCKMEWFEKLVAEDIEFYHDVTGINKGKSGFMETTRRNLCSTGKNPTHRDLVNESMEIFPLYNNGELYGALQNGEHLFTEGRAKFSHLWILNNDEWQLSRVISFEHKGR